VELDLEAATSIPRFGKTQRVVSFTSLNRPLNRIDDIFEQCRQAKADVVKFTWLTEDMDAAWPLLAAVTQPRDLPIVGLGVGRAGLTFSLLGRKYGSPWIYAALEPGMEAFARQPTVWQLRDDYHWDAINNKTRFLGVIGYGESENITSRVLNAAFQQMDRPIRCLPLQPGDLSRFPKMLEKLGINGLIVDPAWRGDLFDLVTSSDEIGTAARRCDVLMEGPQGRRGVCTIFEAMDIAGRPVTGSPEWTGRGAVTVLGHGPMARAAATFFSQRGAAVSLAGMSDNAAAGMAREAGVRHVVWNAVYDQRCDTLVLADPDMPCGLSKGQVNPGIIRERQIVVDLTVGLSGSPFAEESAARGARYIDPASVFAANVNLQFKQLTGKDLPPNSFERALAD
jgi:3-dehydroquinate dehydratase/shikimate dehydrogenase